VLTLWATCLQDRRPPAATTRLPQFHGVLTVQASSWRVQGLQIVREVRRILNDILAGEPYHPKLLSRLLTIGQVPNGLPEQYHLGLKGDGKPMKVLYTVCVCEFVTAPLPLSQAGTAVPQRQHYASYDGEVRQVLRGCLTSIHKKWTEDDSKKCIRLIGTYCVLGVLGKFFDSSVFQDAVHVICVAWRRRDSATTWLPCTRS